MLLRHPRKTRPIRHKSVLSVFMSNSGQLGDLIFILEINYRFVIDLALSLRSTLAAEITVGGLLIFSNPPWSLNTVPLPVVAEFVADIRE